MVNEKAFRLDLTVAVAALLISGVAAGASAYQTYVIRKQFSATVWPYLTYITSSSPDKFFELDISNAGIGPALIFNAVVTRDGKPIERPVGPTITPALGAGDSPGTRRYPGRGEPLARARRREYDGEQHRCRRRHSGGFESRTASRRRKASRKSRDCRHTPHRSHDMLLLALGRLLDQTALGRRRAAQTRPAAARTLKEITREPEVFGCRLSGSLLLAGCALSNGNAVPQASHTALSRTALLPDKRGKITIFDDTFGDATPYGITAGPDGAIWFTDPGNDVIGRITTDGNYTLQQPAGVEISTGITVGPDNNLWFTVEQDDAMIGRITPSGTVTLFKDPGGSYSAGNNDRPRWRPLVRRVQRHGWTHDHQGQGQALYARWDVHGVCRASLPVPTRISG